MAVYTPVTAAEVAAFIQSMNLGEYVRHDGITQGVENTNYHLFTTAGRYILTIFEKRIDSRDLPFVFAYTDHLGAAGLPVPRVLGGGTLAGKPAAVISFLQGADVVNEDLTPDHCARIGTALAQMHLCAKTFAGTRKNPVGFEQWRALYDGVRDRATPEQCALIERTLQEYAPATDLPRGAVHADLFPNNVFFDADGQLSGLIDFYFACTEVYIYDVAMTVNAWCIDRDGILRADCFAAFARAYQSVRPLSDAERAAFPIQRRAAALRIFMTRLYDWHFTPDGAQVKKLDPEEYHKKLIVECAWPS